MAALELDNVSVSLSGAKVLQDVSLQVEEGEVVALVGPSGGGKSTLARAALGLVRLDAGAVRWFGSDLAQCKPEALRQLRRRVQLIFQSPSAALDPRWSVRDLLEEPWHVHKLGSAAQMNARVKQVLEEVDLSEGVLPRFPSELSGGERQRVGYARALLLEPDVLVADEPFSAVDAVGQQRMVDMLLALRQRRGLACLLVTHDLRRVRRLADRVAVLVDGRIVEVGATHDLFNHPKHSRTQSLLAATPWLPGEGPKESPCSG